MPCGRGLTTKTARSPVSGSCVAVTTTWSTGPKAVVSTVSQATAGRSTVPPAYFAVSAKGWKIVCFHDAPPGRVTMGAMTLTSCAWHAIETRSVCCRRVMRRLPTTTASVTSETSSMSSGASRISSELSAWTRSWNHTFHSSKETMIRLSPP